jgi:hypothetical protein
VSRLVVALALVALAAGCAGFGDDDGDPEESPARAMARVIRHELAGRLGSSWALLVREQREAVGRELYVSCRPGPAVDDADVTVLGVRDEVFSVPALGRTDTKAVRWRMTVRSPEEEEPLVLSRTGHLIAQDGAWRWTLSEDSFAAFRAGACP